nr:hypothetical protein Iba_chr04fCG14870 [Ipomoea batatas]
MKGKEEAKEHKTYQWNTKEKMDGANGRRREVRERKEKWKMKGRFMPGERSLRLRLCLATTPLPTTATSFPVSVFTLNPPQSPVMSPLRLHPSPPSSCRLAQVLSFPTPMETDKNCSLLNWSLVFSASNANLHGSGMKISCIIAVL